MADQQGDAVLTAATAAMRAGNTREAARLTETALEQFRQRTDTDGQMRATNLAGAIAFERGRLDEAERAFAEALELAQRLDDRLVEARASNNLASVAHLRGRPEAALSLYRRALLSYQRLGDRRGAAETWHNLALSFRQLPDLHEAGTAAVEAVRHAELDGEPGLIALTMLGKAEVDLERQDFPLVARQIERARELAGKSGDQLGVAEARRVAALLAYRQGQYTRARAEAEAARDTAREQESALLAAECAAVAALAAQAGGDAAAAARLRDQAIAEYRELGADNLITRLEHGWTDPT
jgi:tetratricopeptide (TPR) repeat protein